MKLAYRFTETDDLPGVVNAIFPDTKAWYMEHGDQRCKVILTKMPLPEDLWMLTVGGQARLPTSAEVQAAIEHVGPRGVGFTLEVKEVVKQIPLAHLSPYVVRLIGRRVDA